MSSCFSVTDLQVRGVGIGGAITIWSILCVDPWLSVTVSDPIEANSTVDIFIDSSGDMIQPLSAHATVIRCSQEQDEQWIVGLEITKFN